MQEIGTGFKYMVVSDIAAYFENINLAILKDQIMAQLQNEPIMCNFIIESLSEWVNHSHLGVRPKRGIPQGTSISSFFGNIHLAPIDSFFAKIKQEKEIKYLRYMDDIRIFAKNLSDARYCVFELEKSVRNLHLNLQTAKTEILHEKANDKQISNSLIDERLDLLSRVRTSFENDEIDRTTAAEKLKIVSTKKPENILGDKLNTNKKEISKLTDRATRSWMNLCVKIGDDQYIFNLLNRISVNPDQKYSRIFVNSCIKFPRKSSLGNFAKDFIRSEKSIHQQQAAELMRGCRYLSSIPPEIWTEAENNSRHLDHAFQLRTNSLLLLGMKSQNEQSLKSYGSLLREEKDIIVQPYYFSILGQSSNEELENLIEYYIHHPNYHNQEFGIFLKKSIQDFRTSRVFMNHIFKNDETITDWLGVLHLIAAKGNEKIRSYLNKNISYRLKDRKRKLLRMQLRNIRAKIDIS
ncbi:RNA-directed DNA polymerase [uncultured Roseibium sp.]|uniref:RNA-directed DNA polymerase n=1 Tax=uncultured Roseibium sp. TaxID=1936171 RepID=UPI002623AF20|nr:RNA-directed DNA polymerase [uncultured Roseibium sp.]